MLLKFTAATAKSKLSTTLDYSTPCTNSLAEEQETPFLGVNAIYLSPYYTTHNVWDSIKTYEVYRNVRKSNSLSRYLAINKTRLRITQLLELSEREFKVTVITTLKI